MGTDTSSALDPPTMTAPTPQPPRDKVMPIATMTTQLVDEIRTQPLDTAGLKRLRAIDTHIIGELLTVLTPDLREELQRLALPLTHHTELSDAELRPRPTRGLASGAPPNHPDRPHLDPLKDVPDDVPPDVDNPAIRSARQTLLTAITRRITQRRLTAAQAAAVLHVTGPRVT